MTGKKKEDHSKSNRLVPLQRVRVRVRVRMRGITLCGCVLAKGSSAHLLRGPPSAAGVPFTLSLPGILNSISAL